MYSRIVGYYRPVQQWNKGKQAEYADRVPYKLAGSNQAAWANGKSGITAAIRGKEQ
ncbi:anaerobic ribonucleoside-triphosphate reductase [Zavarzinia sp.]|uniref:anaerobic ribonucleoside-triphosphate reductase n=1 Tax=Zavarzinia sp. TaxID=2027920 RepID=UPI0035688306